MNPWSFLAVAITAEIIGSTSLKASDGLSRSVPALGVVLGYSIAFYFLSLTLKELPLGLTYAVWSGLGTAGTVLVSVALFEEPLNPLKLLALGLIIGGVLLLYLLPGSTA